ncbi:hypothetical protein HRG_004476 [Hirsutella rhossiliensis]|uniref:Uncharacterized protein n=1 Tax=Hirsutella rhossiliensis TaxID=111463 RepID=A0A9P8MXT6_9HYPO|nr:uncharacterized protein HRG_04476 [Hirsutella rhossiliensis]KAH0964048.1 hypothetical protein HRG_04476 [Hirsutella rhossiliensis]
MSASKNPEAMTAAQGEFRSRVPPSEPMTTRGHAPGVKVGKDRVPEFHAEAHMPGTAPANQSFRPGPVGEFAGHAGTNAFDSLTGASSADVHQGYGHPGEGMTSQELHGGKRKKVGAGLEGVGANSSDPMREYGLDREHPTGYRGKATEGYPDAEERLPVSAEKVASERR